MHIDELAAYFGISKWTIYYYRRRGAIDPPVGRGACAVWPNSVVRQIRQLRETVVDGRVTVADVAENRAKYLGVS